MTCPVCHQGHHPHTRNDDCMQAILNRMRLLSYGKVINNAIQASRHSTTRSNPPTLTGYEHVGTKLEVIEHTHWGERYVLAMGDHDRQLEVIIAARDMLHTIQHSRADRTKHNPVELWEDLRADLTAPETIGCDPTWVAQAKNSSRNTVIRARLELHLNPATGHKQQGTPTVRDLAALAGISKTTVAKILTNATPPTAPPTSKYDRRHAA